MHFQRPKMQGPKQFGVKYFAQGHWNICHWIISLALLVESQMGHMTLLPCCYRPNSGSPLWETWQQFCPRLWYLQIYKCRKIQPFYCIRETAVRPSRSRLQALIRGWVVEAAVRAEMPRLSPPQTLPPALLGGLPGQPRDIVFLGISSAGKCLEHLCRVSWSMNSNKTTPTSWNI